MTAPVRAASLLLFLAIIALGGGLLALHFAGASPAQAQDGSAPAQPTGLAAEVAHERVNLTWDDPNDDSITHYQIFRRDRDIHDTGEFVTIDSNTRSATTSYTDDTVEPEKRYVYRVVAVNDNGESKWSEFARANTPAAPDPADLAPSGLEVSLVENRVTLTWDAPASDAASVTGYEILRRRPKEGEKTLTTLVADTGSTETGYTDDTANEPGVRYTYRVKALRDGEQSQVSNFVGIDLPDDYAQDTSGSDGPTPTPKPTPEPTPDPTPEPDKNSPATGQPTIGGTAEVGETLTAEISGISDSDGLTNVSFSYQWLAEDTEIAGATSSTYTPVDADVGKTIKVRVSFADGKNNQEALTSEPTASVAPGSGPLAGFTVVDASDQTMVETLANGGTLALDDPENGSYGIRADVEADTEIGSVRLELTGAKDVDETENLAPYSLYGDGDNGLNGEALPAGQYTLKATAHAERDLNGNVLGTLQVSFTVTGPEDSSGNNPATGAPTITGNAWVSETLTAETSGISDSDGLGSPGYGYQWVRHDETTDSDIGGATDSTYTLVDDDKGKTIAVTVSFTDDEGNAEELTSGATGIVVPAPVVIDPALTPSNLTARGSEESVDLSWDAPTQDADTVTGYQILRGKGDGEDGELEVLVADTESGDTSYTDADVPGNLQDYRYQVKALRGEEASRGSNVAEVLVALAAQGNTVGIPVITGTPRVGHTLIADVSGITDPDGIARTTSAPYQWRRILSGDNVPIFGELAVTYTLVEDDLGKNIAVRYSYIDGENNVEEVESEQVGPVKAALLTALTVDGESVAGFDPGTTSYEFGVASTVTRVTVMGVAYHPDATVTYSPADADGGTEGHQVDLVQGRNVVTATATAEDGVDTRQHTVSVNRGSDAPYGWRADKDFDTLGAAGNIYPRGIWSDGTTMWVSDSSGKLYAYALATRARDADKDFDTLAAAGNTSPRGIGSDGTTMWVTDWFDKKIYAYALATGARDADKDFDTLEEAGNTSPYGLWSDGTTMWVSDSIANKLYAYALATGTRDADKDFDTLEEAGNTIPYGIWSDGTTMWVTDWFDKKLYAYALATGARDADKDFDTLAAAGNTRPHGLWSDGTTMWVSVWDDEKLYAYNMPGSTMNSAPAFASNSATRSVDENTAAASDIGAAVAATDADSDTLSYTLGGTDAASFSIVGTSGQLRTKAALDFESKSSYSVTASVADGNGGTDTIAVTVSVTDVAEPPSAPAAPTVAATANTATSLDVSWTAPDTAGRPAISGYDVQYRKGNSGSWSDWPHTGTAVTATITGLTHSTSYQVRVKAKNAEGESGWSPTGTGSTGTLANNAPAFASNSATRSVAENTAAASDIGAALTATDADSDPLTYTLEGTDAASFDIDSASGQLQTRAALDHESKSSHAVTVKADDGNGGTDTIAVTVSVTDVAEPPSAPAAPTVSATANSSGSLDVSWTAPDMAGKPAISGYHVHYRASPSGVWFDWPHTGTAVTATITRLNHNTSYQVRVTAQNAEGIGGWSASSTGTPAYLGNVVGKPVITGTPRVGDTLISDVSGITDPDGITTPADDVKRGYQWRYYLLSGDNYNVGTGDGSRDRYRMIEDDLGKNFVVRYRYTDGQYNVEEVESEQVGPVKAALLTALTVDGESVAGFDPGTTSYEFGVASTVTRVTVMGVAYHPDATVTYSPADADGGTEGHQVDLVQGRNVVTATATAEDGVDTRQHTVSVNRGSDAPYGWRADKDFDTLGAAGNIYPRGIWSDGTTMWVSDSSSKIYAYALATGARDADKDFDTRETAENTFRGGLWSDGTTMWEADWHYNKIYAYALATGARDADKDFDTLEEAGNTSPSGLWSDGTTMWVADLGETLTVDDYKLYAYALATKARDADKDFDTLEEAGNTSPFGLWSDGTTMWVLDSSDAKLYAYALATGARDADKDFDTLWAAPSGTLSETWYTSRRGLWSDGTTMWVVDSSTLQRTSRVPESGRVVGYQEDQDGKLYAYNMPGSTGNNAPEFSDGTAATRSVDENTASGVNIGAALTATDADSDTLSYTLGGTDAASFAIVSTTGQLRTSAALDFESKSSYSVTASVADGNGGTDSIGVTITVTDVAEAPAAPGAPTVSATANTTDSLDVSWAAPANTGKPAISDYDVQYRAGTSGAWTAHSHTGAATSATITGLTHSTSYQVQVKAKNDEGESGWSASGTGSTGNNAPEFSDGTTTTRSVDENTASGVNIGAALTATDADADTLSYTLGGTDAASFAIVSTTGQLRTSAALDFESKSSYSVTASVADGNGGTDSVAVTVSVSDVAEPPSAPGAPTVSATANTTDSLDVSWTAPANTGKPAISDYDVQYSSDGGTTWSDWPHTGTGTTATITGLTASTSYQVQVKAKNAEGESGWSASGSGSTGTPANNAPVFADATTTRSVAENTAAASDIGTAVTATDADSDTLSYSLEGTDAASFAIVSTTGQLRTSAALDHETKSSYAVTVKADDGRGGTDSIAVTVSVTDVAEAPAAPGAPTVAATANTTDSLDVSWAAPANTGKPAISDYDVQYRAGTSGAWTAHSHTGAATSATITGLTHSTSYQVQVKAKNDEGESGWSASGTGSTGNNAPEFSDGTTTTRSVDENTASGVNIGAALTATDADADTLSYTLGGTDAASFAIVSTTGQLRTSAALDFESKSSYSVTASVADGNGGTDSVAVTVSVSDVAEPPSAPGAPTVSATANTTDSLDVSWTAPANTGKPAISDYDVQYSSDGGTTWSDWPHTGTGTTATITGLTASTSYQVQVKAKNAEGESGWSASGSGSTGNNAPEFSDGTTTARSVDENTASGVNIGTALTATDADSDTLSYTLGGTDAASFAIVSTTGQLRTSAALDFESKSSYSVTASVADGNGGTDSIGVTITVTDVAEAPAAPGAPTVSATANTTDSLDVSWAAPANTGKPAISDYDVQYRAGTSGAWTAHSHTGAATSATITGLTHSTSYQVQVKAKNEEGESGWSASGTGSTGNNAPEFSDGTTTTRSVDENTASGVNIGAALTATDADADTLSYTLGGTDAASFAIVSTTGQLRTSAALDFESKSSYSVTASVADGNGGTDSVAVTVSVSDVAEPPSAPGAPTVSATANTTDSLDVSWTAPANTGKPAISDYDVQYRAGTSGAWTAHSHTGAATTATITGLTASTSYQVQVKAKNAEGESGWSASGTGSTGTPASGPGVGMVTPGSITRTSAVITVTIANPDTNSQTVDLQYKRNADTAWTDVNPKSTVTGPVTFNLSGLTGNTDYDLRASLDGTFASGVVTATFKTSPTAPAPPTSVGITGLGDGELTVEWDAPTDDGGSAITGYKVQWKSGTQSFGSAREHTAVASATSYTIPSLTNGTEYTVRVLAVNSVGDSAPSLTDFDTPVGPPDAPGNVRALPGNAELAVEWDAPANNGGSAITVYTVQWKSSTESYSTSRQATVNPPTTNYTIGSLTNGTAYTVRVKATNANGDSDWTGEESETPTPKPPPSVTIATEEIEPIQGPFTFTVTFNEEVEEFHCYEDEPENPPDGPRCEIGAGYVGGALVDVRDFQEVEVNSAGEHVFSARVEDILTGTLTIFVNEGKAHAKAGGLGNTFGALQVEVERLDQGPRSPSTTVWSSEMIPASIGGYLGYGSVGSQTGGSLDDDSFVLDGQIYTVKALLYNPAQGQLELDLSHALPDQGHRMVLEFDYLNTQQRYHASLEDPREFVVIQDDEQLWTYHWHPAESDLAAGRNVVARLDQQGPGGPPPPPTGLRATPVPAAIALFWDGPPSGVSVSGYHVERRSRKGGEYTVVIIDTGSADTGYTDDTVTAGGEYYYRVTALNSAGESRPSYPVSAGPPGQPQSASALGTREHAALSWDDPQDDSITGYRIERRDRDQGGGFSPLVSDTGGADTGYSDDTVEPGGRYAYRVTALNDYGESDPSDPVEVDIPGGPPDRPTGLGAVATASSVALTWNNPEDDSITGYRIERQGRDGSDGFTTLVADTGSADTGYSDGTVEAGGSYAYRVSASNGDGESQASEPANADVPGGSPPGQPTGLGAVATEEAVTLSWDDPEDDSITGYRIERQGRDGSDGFTTLVADTGSADTGYSDGTVEAGGRYAYRVSAINDDGESPPSAAANADVPGGQAPAKPTGLNATASGDAVTLSWDDPGDDGITGYRIWRRNRDRDPAGQFSVLVDDTHSDATMFTDRGVKPDTRYAYRIAAVNDAGESQWSGSARVRTPPAPVHRDG